MGNKLACCTPQTGEKSLTADFDNIQNPQPRTLSKKKTLQSQPMEEEKQQISTTDGTGEPDDVNGNMDFLDNIEQYEWDGPEDSDEEIAEFADLKQSWEIEAGVKFSKNGLMKYIKQMLAEEKSGLDNANSKLWDQKLKIPGITYYLKTGGSKVSKTQPFFRVEAQFNKVFKIDKLMKVLYGPEHQVKYDKNVKTSDIVPVNNKKTYAYTYYVQKKQFNILGRDYYEKSFMFSHEGTVYRYSCSIADSEKLKPIPDQTVRAECIYNLATITRCSKTGKILLNTLAQNDFKLAVPAFMINTFLPKATKEWLDNVTKYYQKNKNKL